MQCKERGTRWHGRSPLACPDPLLWEEIFGLDLVDPRRDDEVVGAQPACTNVSPIHISSAQFTDESIIHGEVLPAAPLRGVPLAGGQRDGSSMRPNDGRRSGTPAVAGDALRCVHPSH